MHRREKDGLGFNLEVSVECSSFSALAGLDKDEGDITWMHLYHRN